MRRHVEIETKYPKAPRATWGASLSMADGYCWTVARKTYELAAATVISSHSRIVLWNMLPVASQDYWFWRAKFVMTALEELEN